MLYKESSYNIENSSNEINEKLESTITQIIEDKEAQNFPLLNILEDDSKLEKITQIASLICNNFKTLVIIGIGGSSLSGKALVNLNLYNAKTDIFFLENIDSIILERFLNNLDFREAAFLVITKSGKTFETIGIFSIILKYIKEKYNDYNFKKSIFVITTPNNNPIHKIAESIDANIIPHENVSGRFSAFTYVGLLPAAVSGLNIYNIVEGAKYAVNDILYSKNNENLGLVKTIIEKKDSLKNLVIMPYSDRLIDYSSLYKQIWAESTGKAGFGITPVNSIGTIDQHSQLQLYLEGPKDKLFIFITIESKGVGPEIPYFNNKTIGDLMNASQNATTESLIKAKLPVNLIHLNQLNEKELGCLIMKSMLETIIVAKILNINPFDQPAVEKNKVLIEKNLLQ